MAVGIGESPICDCHMHSFSRSQATTVGSYMPPRKDLSDFLQEVTSHHVARAVVVQASVDGTDNSRLAALLRQPNPIELKGVATVELEANHVQQLNDDGVCAIRLQDKPKLAQSQLPDFMDYAGMVAPFGWHIELNTAPASFDALEKLVAQMPHDQILMLDHMAHVNPGNPDHVEQLCHLLSSGRVWTKLSPTRVTRLKETNNYTDLDRLITRLMTDFPTQCVWGSDWPHVMTPEPLPSYGAMLTYFSGLLGDAQFRDCMWRNAARLYWKETITSD